MGRRISKKDIAVQIDRLNKRSVVKYKHIRANALNRLVELWDAKTGAISNVSPCLETGEFYWALVTLNNYLDHEANRKGLSTYGVVGA